MDSLAAHCQPMTLVVLRSMSRTQSWCSQMPSMNTWSSSRVAGRGGRDGDLPAPGGVASEGSVVAVAQLGLAGAGGDPGDEQREVGGLLALRS